MRNAFAEQITMLAKQDDRIVLLSGDIGNRLFDEFKTLFPERFLNCGVAEANMMSVAAGLASDGFRPVVYTIAPFVTTRCLEQIRADICYPALPVTIVAVGAGLSYAALGATHQSLEDIAFLRALPDMSVVCPADALEAKAALPLCIDHNAPVYLRMGKKGEPVVHSTEPQMTLGKSAMLQDGNHACILTTGTMATVALQAAEQLEQEDLSIRVENFHTVKPLDKSALEKCFRRFDLIATIEEHSRIGGFGSAVSEWLADTPFTGKTLLRFGTQDKFIHEATNQESAREYHGLTTDCVAAELRQRLDLRPARFG